ncbi:MAG: hypothetical protein ACXW1Y_12435 [Acidimicrobiia bacterium]
MNILGIGRTQFVRSIRARQKIHQHARKRDLRVRGHRLPEAVVRARFKFSGDHTTPNWTVFRGGSSDRRIGIYALGACDLPSIFAAKPLIAAELDGTCAIIKIGGVADGRSDFLLQALDPPDSRFIGEAVRRLRLPAETFDARVFSPTFQVPDLAGIGEFPKSVTVLSIASDLTRTLYRHNEHGFLLDPGAFWLKQDMATATAARRTMDWVKESFTSVGTLEPEEFAAHFGKVVSLLNETGTTVIVYNMCVVNPGDLSYTYQYRRNPPAMRRMEFNGLLAEMASQYGFSVLNVDRILKREGVQEQVDFAHFPLARIQPIGREFYRILRERDVV